MKTSMQLKSLIRNLSKEKNIQAEIILRNFMLERFLERMSLSIYKDKFILKGGMLIAAMVGIDTRTTMDLDATIKGQAIDKKNIETIINEILEIPIEDNVILKLNDIMEIHEESDYPCFRISINALFDKTKQNIKLDITTGDFITPKEVEYNFKLLFEERFLNVFAYNLETVLAEKFETIIVRSIANTRMRDFYDIYILTLTQDINYSTLNSAIKTTANKRFTSKQLEHYKDVLNIISKNTELRNLWERYRKSYPYSVDITWDMIISKLYEFASKINI